MVVRAHRRLYSQSSVKIPLKQIVARDFFENYFHGEKDEKKIFPINIVVDKIYTYAAVFTINNSFTIKNDKISHLEISTTRATVNGL